MKKQIEVKWFGFQDVMALMLLAREHHKIGNKCSVDFQNSYGKDKKTIVWVNYGGTDGEKERYWSIELNDEASEKYIESVSYVDFCEVVKFLTDKLKECGVDYEV